MTDVEVITKSYTAKGLSEWLRVAPVGTTIVLLREPNTDTSTGAVKHSSVHSLTSRMGIKCIVTRCYVSERADGVPQNAVSILVVNRDGYKPKQIPGVKPVAMRSKVT